MLPDPFDADQAALSEFVPQRSLPRCVGVGVEDLAEGVAGRDVGAAVDPVALVRSGQDRAELTQIRPKAAGGGFLSERPVYPGN